MEEKWKEFVPYVIVSNYGNVKDENGKEIPVFMEGGNKTIHVFGAKLKIHQLVANLFCGYNWSGRLYFIDGNHENCRSSNIQTRENRTKKKMFSPDSEQLGKNITVTHKENEYKLQCWICDKTAYVNLDQLFDGKWHVCEHDLNGGFYDN